jgi:hypothetical protein
MSSSSPSRSIGTTKKPLPAARRANGVIDAVVINTPDLHFFLKLQNLLNYFVDCMNNLTSSAENRTRCSGHLDRCIDIISNIDHNTISIDDDLRRAIDEFIEDAGKFRNLLATFSEPNMSPAENQGTAMLLSAKASHLHWLSVCILEDVKKSYQQSL